MYFSTILLVLASAVGLIHAVAVPQADNPDFDFCRSQFKVIFGPGLNPGLAQCTDCALNAFLVAEEAFREHPGDTNYMKHLYNTSMAYCTGPPDDQTYNTCIRQYNTIFGDETEKGPADCAGCAGEAIAAAALVYQDNPSDIQAARNAYDDYWSTCPP